MRTLRLLEDILTLSRQSTLRRVLTAGFIWTLAWLPVVQARARQLPDEGEGAGRDVSSQARVPHYPIGTSVEVQLRNHEKISGQVEKYARDGFWIKAQGKDSRSNREIFFFDLQSVHPGRSYAGQSGGADGKGDQPRFSLNLSIGGSGAAIRVYQPREPDESEPSESDSPR